MKTTFKYILLFYALLPCSSCIASTGPFDTEIAIVVDKTDRLPVYPTGDEIVSQLGLKDDPWQGVRITATYISDKDINDVTVLTLEAESVWTGNIIVRKAKIQQFIKRLQRCLTGMHYSGTCPYSIIYRTVARQANRLASSTATRKFLVVYSDLYENDGDLNFYDRKVINLLQKNPQSISGQLEATAPLKSVKGLQLWLIYNPTSFKQNNDYMIIASFYDRLFTAHGATTHTANKFVPQ